MERFIVGNWFYTNEIEAESLTDAIYTFLDDSKEHITLDPVQINDKQDSRVYGAPLTQLIHSALQSCHDGLAKAEKLTQFDSIKFFAYHAQQIQITA